MKISILLPLKENFSPNYPGAVSLFINDTLKFIEIRNKQKVFELELQFFNSATIIEKFIIEDIIDSIFQMLLMERFVLN